MRRPSKSQGGENRHAKRIEDVRRKAHAAYDGLENEMDELFSDQTLARAELVAELLRVFDPKVDYMKVLHEDVLLAGKPLPEINEKNAWHVVRAALQQYTDGMHDWKAFEEYPPSAENLYPQIKPYLEDKIKEQVLAESNRRGSSNVRS